MLWHHLTDQGAPVGRVYWNELVWARLWLPGVGNHRWVKSQGVCRTDDREANLSGLSLEWLSLGSGSWEGM